MQFTKCIENEKLSPFFIEPLLAARISEVYSLLEEKENELQNTPAGTLRISKSGKTIQYYQITKTGDTLHRLNIPYRYEFPLEIITEKGIRRTFHPDFICLNLRTRQEFIWEHFGKMDDAEYASNAAQKLRLYEKNGIFPGKNLIISMETSTSPINSMQVEKTAKQYLI